MADPFSIATGVIGLAETGTSLASFLTDKYKAYRDAPAQILELAHEVEFCAGLIDIFASTLEGSSQQKNRRRSQSARDTGVGAANGSGGNPGQDRFTTDARNLINQTRAVFDEVYALIPPDRELDDSARARWHYVRDKKKLSKLQTRLRELQQMFMFLDTVRRYRESSSAQSNGDGFGVAGVGDVQGWDGDEMPGKFEGVLRQVQSQMGEEDDAVPSPVEFQVSISLIPRRDRNENAAATYSAPMPQTRSALAGEEKRESRDRLENLRRSPYFSTELLEPPKVQVRSAAPSLKSGAVPYAEVIDMDESEEQETGEDSGDDIDESRTRVSIMSREEAGKDVDELLGRWFDDNSRFASTEQDTTGSAGHVIVISPSVDNDHTESSTLPRETDASNAVNGTGQVQFAPFDTATSPPAVRPRAAKVRRGPASVASTATQASSARTPLPLALEWMCHECFQKRYGGRKFHCTKCRDFDLCKDCFGDDDSLIRHRHPRADFMELKAVEPGIAL